MKKRINTRIVTVIAAMSLIVGCGSKAPVSEGGGSAETNSRSTGDVIEISL